MMGEYISIVRYGMIHNYPITPESVTIVNTVFGPGIATLKVKTARKSSEPVLTDYVEIPQCILDLNNELTLSEDVMFINGIG